MKLLRVTIFSFVACAIFSAGWLTGGWAQRKEWGDARDYVEKDLVSRGQDPSHLGPTELIDGQGEEATYGFTYNFGAAHYDYTVSFTGPRGITVAFWDYARTD